MRLQCVHRASTTCPDPNVDTVAGTGLPHSTHTGMHACRRGKRGRREANACAYERCTPPFKASALLFDATISTGQALLTSLLVLGANRSSHFFSLFD